MASAEIVKKLLSMGIFHMNWSAGVAGRSFHLSRSMSSPFHLKTISHALEQGGDNFLLLRFLAASMVIYGHAPSIAVGNAPTDLFVWLNWGQYSGAIAVDLFFVISGFLITGSFLRRQNAIDFVWARFIRIVPAYAVCLALCAFVLGPLDTSLPLPDYFANAGTFDYVLHNLQFRPDLIYLLPGVFEEKFRNPNGHGPCVNASIWTLPAEVRMYAWVVLAGLSGVLNSRLFFNIALIGLFLFSIPHSQDIPLVPIPQYLRLAGLFAAGAFCNVNRSWIPIHGGLLVATAGLAYLCRSNGIYPFLFAACEVQFVFWFAYNTPWRGFNRFGDYSYGIYLWGWPSQQLVVGATAGMILLPVLVSALCAFVVALGLAIVSWHAIEKPALETKRVPSEIRRRLKEAIAF